MDAGPVDDGRGIGVGSEEVPAENNTTQDAERPDHATRTTAAATNRTGVFGSIKPSKKLFFEGFE